MIIERFGIYRFDIFTAVDITYCLRIAYILADLHVAKIFSASCNLFSCILYVIQCLVWLIANEKLIKLTNPVYYFLIGNTINDLFQIVSSTAITRNYCLKTWCTINCFLFIDISFVMLPDDRQQKQKMYCKWLVFEIQSNVAT